VPMDELNKFDAILLTGQARVNALSEFRAQTAEWGIALPPVEALVSDFGLGDFATTGLIEYWIANEVDAGYCGKYLFVFDGQSCPMHDHRLKHETFFIVKGKVRIDLDGGDSRELSEGDVLPVPPGQIHGFTGIGPCLLLEVSQPCLAGDSYFVNSDIPIIPESK
jgi:mannose-6-phosphate isomerase-like protein (cupin superfamily)